MEPSLALVACGPQLEVALGARHLPTPSVVRLSGQTPRSSLLLAAVDLVVDDAGFVADDVAVVVIGRGPGSFTGIRTAVATAEGMRAAIGLRVVAYNSLRMQAARCRRTGTVWAAQPGRRGEAYAQPFATSADGPPMPSGEVEIVRTEAAIGREPWVAPEALDLGPATRETAVVSAGEALLRLLAWNLPSDPLEPLYIEGPPIHRPSGSRP